MGVWKLRLHVLGLAHVPTIAKDPAWACAYTQKVRRFIEMMVSLPGYRVIFYGAEGSRTKAHEQVIVVDEKTRRKVYGPLEPKPGMFHIDRNNEAYQTFIHNAIPEILKRKQPQDILCNPMGQTYLDIVNAVGLQSVETGVGYTGFILGPSPPNMRVFESEAWRNYCYGRMNLENGSFYDAVIPNAYNPDDYHLAPKKDFFLQNSRVIHRKGIEISRQVCKALGLKLVLIGVPQENVNLEGVDYRGYVSETEKRKLLSEARALFCPTMYLGPFEGVAVEAMLSGTPVISTNFGCFTETVQQGVNGWRCNNFKEFLDAAKAARKFKRNKKIREQAIAHYGMENVRFQYDAYFKRVNALWRKGWYEP